MSTRLDIGVEIDADSIAIYPRTNIFKAGPLTGRILNNKVEIVLPQNVAISNYADHSEWNVKKATMHMIGNAYVATKNAKIKANEILVTWLDE